MNPIELLLARNDLILLANIVTNAASKLDLDDLSSHYQGQIDRFNQFKAEKELKKDKPGFDRENLVMRFNSFFAERLQAEITDQELKPSIRAEQANLGWRTFLLGFLLIASTTALLALISSLLKKSDDQFARRSTAFGILIPVIGFLLIRYLTPWGGFDRGPG